MREYTAKKSNLEIKLTTLNGEEKLLKTTEPMNASKATKIGNSWVKYEEAITEKQRQINRDSKELRELEYKIKPNEEEKERIKILREQIEKNKIDDGPTQIAKELSFVYSNVDPQWFLDNVDLETLQNILRDTAEELTGLKKSEVSSR